MFSTGTEKDKDKGDVYKIEISKNLADKPIDSGKEIIKE